jgi:hypothetical protein
MRWAFWIACGLAAIAGVAPFLLGGSSNRISSVVFPFALGAVGLAACALLYQHGKLIVSLLYVVAGLAVAYGILATLATPLRLAVIGTCPPEPASCAPGLERPLTSGEMTALSLAIGFGVVAIMVGYFGLVVVYRRRAALSPSTPLTPPVRRIAPVGARTPAEIPPAQPASEPAAEATPEAQLELSAPEPQLELPAPTPEEMDETPSAAATPAPSRKPRRRPGPKAPPDAPPAPNSDP